MIGFVILLTLNFGHQDTDMGSFLNAFYLNFEFVDTFFLIFFSIFR